MALRDQLRRPLLLILLVVVPAYVVTRSIATTEATPRLIELPDGSVIATTMRELHGAIMAGMTIGFVAALVGVFVMQSALLGDRRLVLAGYRPFEAITARLLVLISLTALVVAVSALVTAAHFTPMLWPTFLLSLVLIGLIYASIGALAGAVLDKLAATYLIFFLALTDLGVVQNPMFGDGAPADWAVILPGYGPSRLMVGAAFSPTLHPFDDLVLSLAWVLILGGGAFLVLRRSIGRQG